MKRTILLAIVIFGFCLSAFAQEDARVRKNAVTLDTIPLFKGFVATDSDGNFFFYMAFAYERLIFPHFSVGGEVELIPGTAGSEPYFYLGVAASARFYFTEYMEKFFLGVTLGFNMQIVNGKIDPQYSGFAGMSVGLKAGYKLMLGKMFFVEPSMGYNYSKTHTSLFGTTPQNIGWQAGLRVGISF